MVFMTDMPTLTQSSANSTLTLTTHTVNLLGLNLWAGLGGVCA